VTGIPTPTWSVEDCRKGPSGLVLDDDLLAPALAQLLCDHAAEHVRGTAGGERHYQPDRLAGIGLLGPG